MAGYTIKFDKDSDGVIKEILTNKFEENIRNWMQEIEDETSPSVKEFIYAMDQLFTEVSQKQNNGEKRQIDKIYIHYLQSSRLDGSFDLVINAYSKAVYFDICETEKYWCPSKVKNYYNDALVFLQQQIIRKHLLIDYSIISEIERKHYIDYMYFLPKLCNLYMPNVMKLDSFKRCDVNKDLLVMFGEYMGNVQPIFIHFSEDTLAEFEKNAIHEAVNEAGK